MYPFASWLAFLGYYVLVVALAVHFCKKHLTGLQIAAALTLKIVAACLFGYFFLHHANGAVIDTWYYHTEGWKEYQLLKTNPIQFLRKDILDHGYASATDTIFHQQNSFAKDLQHNLLIKLVAILHAFSGGNYYINALLYASLCFPASVWLYKLGKLYQPTAEARKYLYLLCFYTPSFLFWNSGIMKDGVTVLAAIACLYSMVQYDVTHRAKYIATGMLALVLCFALRQFVAVSLVVGFAAFWLQNRLAWRTSFTVLVVLSAVTILLAINTVWWPYPVNFLEKIMDRSRAFMALAQASGSALFLPAADGAGFFIAAIPYAIKNSLLAPTVPISTQFSNVVAAIYHILFLGFCSVALTRKRSQSSTAVSALLWVVIIINVLLIGYTVPVAGAIVRYRSWLEWLLLFQIWLRRLH
jgi:hypothetical protein